MAWRIGVRRLIALLAGAALLVGPAAAADPSDRLEEIERRRAKLHARQLALEARGNEVFELLADLDARRAVAEERVAELDRRLERLDERIGIVRDELTAAQQDLTIVTAELLDVQTDLVERTDVFTERARAAYMTGSTAYLESFLSAENFSDLVDRVAYHEAVMNADASLIDEIAALRDETEARRATVEERNLEIARAKLALERNRDSLESLHAQRMSVLDARESAVAAKSAALATIEARKSELRSLEAQLSADAARIQGLLQGGSIGSPTGTGQLLWPTSGPVTSPYGYRTHPIFGDQRLHTGIDIGAAYGAPVFASDYGVVAFAGVMSGYGNVIVIDHGGGLATTYNHLSSFGVAQGQEVARGVQVGAVGCTGYCTGPHLHFEVRVNGSPVDPMPYLS